MKVSPKGTAASEGTGVGFAGLLVGRGLLSVGTGVRFAGLLVGRGLLSVGAGVGVAGLSVGRGFPLVGVGAALAGLSVGMGLLSAGARLASSGSGPATDPPQETTNKVMRISHDRFVIEQLNDGYDSAILAGNMVTLAGKNTNRVPNQSNQS